MKRRNSRYGILCDLLDVAKELGDVSVNWEIVTLGLRSALVRAERFEKQQRESGQAG